MTTTENVSGKTSHQPTSNHQDRPKFVILIGKTIIFLTIVSFLFVGLIINCLQLCLLLTFRLSNKPAWKEAHKRINGYLIYVLFAPCICLLYLLSRASLDIKLNDIKLVEDSQKPMVAVMVPNHSYELDYMICFLLADQFGNLGSYKSFSKEELKHLPIIGWAIWMSDIIFVKRNWEQDRRELPAKLNRLLDYEQMLICLFAEGTRWTPEKHQHSVEFAKSRNIQPLKHHLIPKSRGFNLTIRHLVKSMAADQRLAQKPLRLFNLEFVMPDKPTFGDFLNSRQLRADIYCEEVELSQELRQEILRLDDDDDCPSLNRLLLDMYRRKDELVDEYYANGCKFTYNPKTGGQFKYAPRKLPTAIWLFSNCLTYSTLTYLALYTFSDSVVFWSILLCFLTSCALMLRKIDYESNAMNSKSFVKKTQEEGSKLKLQLIDSTESSSSLKEMQADLCHTCVTTAIGKIRLM